MKAILLMLGMMFSVCLQLHAQEIQVGHPSEDVVMSYAEQLVRKFEFSVINAANCKDCEFDIPALLRQSFAPGATIEVSNISMDKKDIATTVRIDTLDAGVYYQNLLNLKKDGVYDKMPIKFFPMSATSRMINCFDNGCAIEFPIDQMTACYKNNKLVYGDMTVKMIWITFSQNASGKYEVLIRKITVVETKKLSKK